MADPLGAEQVIRLSDGEAVASHAAARFVEAAAAAVSKRGRFAVALAGGSTPRRLYGLLAEPKFRNRIDWRRVEVFFGDERSVAPDHPHSNFRMAAEALLNHVPVVPERIHRMGGEEQDLDSAARRYEEELAAAFAVAPGQGPPALDLILLGIGADAHTASLFPYTAALNETRRWVVANYVPSKNTCRLTFTAPLINQAGCILFLVVGEDKAAALTHVLEGAREPERSPAQLIRPVRGSVLWLVDEEAAGLLKRAVSRE